MADYISSSIENEEEKSSFDIQSIITMIYLNWYWILLSMFICFACAKIYLRYTPPVYSAGVKVLIKNASSNRRSSGRGYSGLEEMGTIAMAGSFENELEIMKSTAVAKKVAKALKLYASYSLEGRVKDAELYHDTPILVDIAEADLENLHTSIQMTITTQGKGIHVKGRVGGRHPFSQDISSYPATLQTAGGTLIFQQNPGFSIPKGKELYVTISPLIDAARQYASRLGTSDKDRTTTTTSNLVYFDTKIDRAIDYLSQLIDSYNEDANEDKNEVARKTEKFIAERIEVIRAELDSAEIGIETFKKDNELINLPNNASAAFSHTQQYQQEQVNMQIQLILLKALTDYIENPENKREAIPSNLGVNNSTLNSSIEQYNELVTRRKRLLKTTTETNPSVVRLTSQIDDMLPMIEASLKSVHQELLIRKNSIDTQYQKFNRQVFETPTQERILTNITRQQGIKAELYLMLLQKREQNFISLASTATKARIIDEPRPMGKVSPDEKKILLTALGIGCAAPIVLLILLSLLRYRIEGRDDVERLTSIPILADVPMAFDNNIDGNGIVVNENKNDMMEESFRGLRTNLLRFVLSGSEKVILCTSCIPGEGKTFIACNLAMSLSLLGKHVLLIGLDIRKPRLRNVFNIKQNEKGITSFLALDEPNYDILNDNIHHGLINKNLDVLPAGLIPPNPTELISRPLLDEGIKHLKNKYDYIILDTPPIGLVSDTLEMARIADTTLFVVRADYSIKANFGLVNSIKNENKMPKINLVLNGIDFKKKKYGYYYGYGKYGVRGKYGYYGKYSHYGHYGVYGNYQDNGKESNG